MQFYAKIYLNFWFQKNILNIFALVWDVQFYLNQKWRVINWKKLHQFWTLAVMTYPTFFSQRRNP